MQDTDSIIADLTEIDGQPMTDSLKVAARFGKDHSKVLRSIREIRRTQPEFHAANFGELIDHVEVGKGAMRPRTIFSMTKDGFVFLSMGFTGKEAAAFKIAYINAFNRMAEEIARAAHVPAVPLTLHEQAMKLHGESETSKSLASIYGRGLRKRRDEKPVFERQLAKLERAMQLCLMLGLDGLPDVD